MKNEINNNYYLKYMKYKKKYNLIKYGGGIDNSITELDEIKDTFMT